ncbi:MAG: DUF3617 family protein [Caulobacteraceae bacterium]
MRRALVLSISLLALAACAKPAEKPAEPAAYAESTARSPGLWELRISDGENVQVQRECLDAATDKQLSLIGRQTNDQNCEKHLMTRQPDGSWRFSTVCDMGSGGVVKSEGTATGDFATRYQMRVEQSTSGAAVPMLNGNRRLVIDAARVSSQCPAGMKPGEAELPGGRRINMVEISAPPAPSAPVVQPATSAAPQAQ